MASLTLRNVKGTPLTNTEIDNNFTNLNTELSAKLDSPASNGITIRTGSTTSVNRSVVASGVGLTVTNGTGVAGDITIVSSATAANTPSTLVFRDSSGNFSANTITANLTGDVTGNLNGIIGAASPAAGTFTTLTANTSVSGTGFTNYFASPPALGSSAANTVRGTTVTATTTFTGPIGSASASAGAFTTLSASANTTLTSTLTVNGSVGTSVQVLKSRGAGLSPQWGLVTLTSDVTGTLPISNGGTGATTQAAALSNILGSSAIAISNGGTGATTQSGALANIVGYTPIQQGGGTSQLANKLYIGWSSSSQLRLQIDSTDFGGNWPINSQNVTGIVGRANGGTGLISAGAAGNILTSDGTNWTSSPPPTGVTPSTGSAPYYGFRAWAVVRNNGTTYTILAGGGISSVAWSNSGQTATVTIAPANRPATVDYGVLVSCATTPAQTGQRYGTVTSQTTSTFVINFSDDPTLNPVGIFTIALVF